MNRMNRMLKKSWVICVVLMFSILLCSCASQTYTSVSAVTKNGQPGDRVNFAAAKVQAISYSPIMLQSSFHLTTGEGEDYVTAIAANTVIKSGLERIMMEERDLLVSLSGRLSEHDVLGKLIFIDELRVIDSSETKLN